MQLLARVRAARAEATSTSAAAAFGHIVSRRIDSLRRAARSAIRIHTSSLGGASAMADSWHELTATPSEPSPTSTSARAAARVQSRFSACACLKPDAARWTPAAAAREPAWRVAEHDGPRVEWTADEPGQSILSGGALVGEWSSMGTAHGGFPTVADRPPLWRAPLPERNDGNLRATGRQLWCDGARMTRARHPNDGYLRWASALPAPFDAWGLVYEPNQGLEALRGALHGAEAIVFHSWTASRHVVVAHNATARTLIFDRPAHQPLGAHLRQSGRRFFLEGFRGALDAANEFAQVGDSLLLAAEQKPADGACVAAPACRRCCAPRAPSRCAASCWSTRTGSCPRRRQPADFQAAAWLPHAALQLRFARGAELEALTIRHTGGYGAWLADGVQNTTFSDSTLSDLGAGGVRVGVASSTRRRRMTMRCSAST